MTDYLVYRNQGGTLVPFGETDAHNPEEAVSQLVKQNAPSNGNTDEVDGSYAAVAKRSLANIQVKLEPSVRVRIDSDRQVVPRKQPEPAAAPSA